MNRADPVVLVDNWPDAVALNPRARSCAMSVAPMGIEGSVTNSDVPA